MEVEFLGTGTSTGVPQIGCHCDVCNSQDSKDKRLRASIILRTNNKNILIDCGPDFHTQMLRASDCHIDALLLTHSHYDHVGGVDDLRPYCIDRPFPIYAQENVLNDLRNRIPYCFKPNPYPGVPSFNLIEINQEPFFFEGVKIEPLPIWHYKLLIYGYRIEDFAYITDAKTIDSEVIESLKGINTLVINALRLKPHMSHMSLSETLEVINQIQPVHAFLTHISHDMGLHEDVSKILPSNVKLAHDNLRIMI